MYMYYLLGYRLFGRETNFIYEELLADKRKKDKKKKDKQGKMSWAQTVLKQKSHFGKSQIFDEMEEMLLIQVKA